MNSRTEGLAAIFPCKPICHLGRVPVSLASLLGYLTYQLLPILHLRPLACARGRGRARAFGYSILMVLVLDLGTASLAILGRIKEVGPGQDCHSDRAFVVGAG